MAYHFVIQGHLGSGKTFLASIIAKLWKFKVAKMGGDIKIFSNYDLEGSIPITHYEDWYEVAKCQGSICVWDEAYMAFSNRKWSKYGQGIITDVLMLTRKMKSVQIYCTPSIKFLDSRVREITEVLVTATKIGNKGFEYIFHDYQTGRFLVRHFLPMGKAKNIMKLNLYDTDTMVRYFPVPQNDRDGEKFFDELDRIHDEARARRKKKHEN